MRLIARAPVSTADPVTVADLAHHLRLETAEAMEAMRYAQAAAREIEDHARVALLTQDIVAEADADEAAGLVLVLPVTPIYTATLSVTVETLTPDRTAEAFTDFALANTWPLAVHLDYDPEKPVRITYRAGHGEPEDVPADLRHAVLDQALRLYDMRGDRDAPATLAPSAARISARYRRVSLGAA